MDRAQARQEAVVSRRIDGGSTGHRAARRGGRPAGLYDASDDGNAAGTGVPRPPGAAGDGGVLRDRRVSRRGVDQGKAERDGLAGLRDECRGDDAGSGGVGVPGPVSDRGRLVALKGSVAGTRLWSLRPSAWLTVPETAAISCGVAPAHRRPGPGRPENPRRSWWKADPQDSRCRIAIGADDPALIL